VDTLPADTWRAWLEHATAQVARHRTRIDRMNVYPIADGDTGSNVLGTLQSGRAEAVACWFAPQEPSAQGVAQAAARGATLGARGNSGVILAQWFQGMAEVADQPLHQMLAQGARRAREAVSHPVEGTMLTVAQAAADAATAEAAAAHSSPSNSQSSREDCCAAALAAGQVALQRTPTLLPVLAQAGVLDAGGAALLLVLQALQAAVAGAPLEQVNFADLDLGPSTPQITMPLPTVPAFGTGMQYEVMFTLHAEDQDALATLRQELDGLGDSLVIAGGPQVWQVHLHVPDAQASTKALQLGIAAGSTQRVRVTELTSTTCLHEPGVKRPLRALVAVTHGDGVTALLHDSGVVTLMVGAGRPSTAEFLDAVTATGARQVIVLPSDSDAHGAAELAARQARTQGLEVAVIPTRAVAQTLAAVAVHDGDRSLQDDVVTMTRAAGATRYAGITVASRNALTMAGPCRIGDVLGLVAGDIAIIGHEVQEVCERVLAGMLTVGGELVTLVWGAEAAPALRTSLTRWLAEQHPFVEVQHVEGEQARWPLIVGVE
jgi:DAK2 domain fusion protein YloV